MRPTTLIAIALAGTTVVAAVMEARVVFLERRALVPQVRGARQSAFRYWAIYRTDTLEQAVKEYSPTNDDQRAALMQVHAGKRSMLLTWQRDLLSGVPQNPFVGSWTADLSTSRLDPKMPLKGADLTIGISGNVVTLSGWAETLGMCLAERVGFEPSRTV